MAGLSNLGYIKRTAEEIKNDLIEAIQKEIPEFVDQSTDIQSALLNTAVADILQYENLVSTMMNCYSMAESDEMLFRMQAEELGLRQKSEFKSQVTLTFRGLPGDIIPKGTKVSTTLKKDIFETTESIILGSTGEGNVLALSDIDYTIDKGKLNTLISVISSGIGVTNLTASLPKIQEEPFENFKLRSQARLRSPRMGGQLYAESLINSIDGVDSRLVAFYGVEYTEKDTEEKGEVYYKIKGIEAVIGGGDQIQIAFALYQSFFETQKLISQPSDSDTTRTINQEVYVYDNIINIKFTRPKLLKLNLKFKITFVGKLSSAQAVKDGTIESLTQFINTLKVGKPINLYSLIEIITPSLISMGLPTSTYKAISFQYAIGDFTEGGDRHNDLVDDGKGNKVIPWLDFNEDGRISEVEKDCYCELASYEVQLNA
ncbi:TPA: baseplate J/gp47 family protein [Campylobacter coli]|nr:baseplate J/gp47 family protein [Campylobacter coli]